MLLGEPDDFGVDLIESERIGGVAVHGERAGSEADEAEPFETREKLGLYWGNSALLGILALLAFVYLGGITTSYGAIAGGVLVAGGVSAEIGALHFDGVTQAIINLVGAIGLIVNAIVTNGEGIALLQTDQGKHILSGLRRDPSIAPEDTVLNISQEELAGAPSEGAIA